LARLLIALGAQLVLFLARSQLIALIEKKASNGFFDLLLGCLALDRALVRIHTSCLVEKLGKLGSLFWCWRFCRR